MLVLFYTSFFGAPAPVKPWDSKTILTHDRRRLREADVVVFHLPNASEMGGARRYPGQVWVAWTMESRTNTPLLDDPQVMRQFDLTMTFERSADVWCPYLPPLQRWQQMQARPLRPRIHDSPLVMFQSATLDRSGRNAFCTELMRHLPVDSYGRFLNNRRIEGPDRGYETKLEVVGSYKFALGAENTIERDYVTEKFFQPLLAGAVPVYRGAPNVEDFAPGDNCYIDANDFASPAELAAYLRRLDADPAAYARYHEWRSRPLRSSFLELLRQCETEAFSRLVDLVAERRSPSRPGSLLPFGARRHATMQVAALRRWLGPRLARLLWRR